MFIQKLAVDTTPTVAAAAAAGPPVIAEMIAPRMPTPVET
jgi:hypothetical protein